MKKKFFRPWFLLTVSVLLVFACSKQESMPGLSGERLQTSIRSAEVPVSDSLAGSWLLLSVQVITSDKSTPWITDTITTHYGMGDFIVKFFGNGNGLEVIKVSPGEYRSISFTYQDTTHRHVLIQEQQGDLRKYDFGVHFSHQSSNEVQLIEDIEESQARKKTIWNMCRARDDHRHRRGF